MEQPNSEGEVWGQQPSSEDKQQPSSEDKQQSSSEDNQQSNSEVWGLLLPMRRHVTALGE